MNKHSDNNDFSTRRTRVNNHEKNEAICLCPLEGVIDIISKKWALLIINEIGNHTRIRYNDLMKELGNISPKTLADTLKELNKYDLVRRESFNEIPPRVDYSLTNNGQELRRAIIPILQWAISRKGTVVAHCSCSMIEKGKTIRITSKQQQ
jgi:DNA-binding HxlR family transcriptional regulator